jgi:hypothetical protein
MTKEFEWFLRQFDDETTTCGVKLLGIRGWFHENQQGGKNNLGVYDDLIVSFIEDEGAKFAASVDPGWYWIENPELEGQKYCAQLVEGVHKFKLGSHDDGKYPALVQAEKFHIHRLDKKGRIVLTEFGEFDIHLHSGSTGPEVGSYSAGCQIIECPEGYFGQTWLNFFNPVRDAMSDRNQDVVPYVLIERDEMVP